MTILAIILILACLILPALAWPILIRWLVLREGGEEGAMR